MVPVLADTVLIVVLATAAFWAHLFLTGFLLAGIGALFVLRRFRSRSSFYLWANVLKGTCAACLLSMPVLLFVAIRLQTIDCVLAACLVFVTGAVTLILWASAVDESRFYDPSIYWGVSIRLAFSDDNGSTWQDAGVAVSTFSEHAVGPLTVTNPAPPIDAGSNGIWQSETSTLIYDPAASEAERWKLLWFQYLHADGTSYFLHQAMNEV